MGDRVQASAGELAVATLTGFGVDVMFTLNGGHIWPFYEGARNHGVRVVDTRHEQTATWAAEAWAKLTRSVGLAVVTAGPGVTNSMSALSSASFNGAPLVVLGGRAPLARWGSGSLQEFDHVPIVAPVTKSAVTVTDGADVAKAVHAAVLTSLTAHRGPTFIDVPMDVLFARTEADVPAPAEPERIAPDPDEVARAAALIAGASRPAIIAGSDVYWEGAWEALAAAVSTWWARPSGLSVTWTTRADPNAPKPSRKSSGVPMTTTTSASALSRPRVRLKASGWSAGRQPRPMPLAKHGTRRCSRAAARASQAPSQ